MADAQEDRDARGGSAATRFVDTMPLVRARELGNAFGRGAGAARAVLDDLAERGEVPRDGPGYRSGSFPVGRTATTR